MKTLLILGLLLVAASVLALLAVALPVSFSFFGLLCGVAGTVVGLAAAAFAVLVAILSVVFAGLVILAPLWVPVLLIVLIVSLCRRT